MSCKGRATPTMTLHVIELMKQYTISVNRLIPKKMRFIGDIVHYNVQQFFGAMRFSGIHMD